MKLDSKKNYFKFLLFALFLNSLIVTPFANKDGMIIPKMMLMFVIALFLLPILTINRELFFKQRIEKIFLVINLIILIYSTVVILVSSAPLEQQIYGRTGRGLGLITIISLSAVSLAAIAFISQSNSKRILSWVIVGAVLSSGYSVLQSFGIDLLKWDSRTNGVIGTLGNPNFQSAFAAMVLVPSLLYFWGNRKLLLFGLLIGIFLLFTIYRTQSRQGFVAGFFSIAATILIYFWYKSKIFFSISFFSSFIFGVYTLLGMLNRGPLSGYLYNASVESRGDFWRSAFTTANEHPFFGVGLDSFGDYFLKYRDAIAANHSFAEYTDNAHNFFLEHAATGGYPFAFLNFFLVTLVLYSYFKIQKSINKFDPVIVSLFASWLAFQMTSVISPGNLVTMHWNAALSGVIIGLLKFYVVNFSSIAESNNKTKNSWITSSILSILGIILVIPYFNADRLQLKGMQSGDANLVMKATMSFPESTVRYSLIGRELLNSGLTQQSLELARSGVKFNPNSAGLWALILVNPSATLEERLIAKQEILELDPLNKDVKNFNP
jgi:O-antigen ligase